MKSFNDAGRVTRLACEAAIALAMTAGQVYAQAQPAPAETRVERQFDVPEGTLATALARFGEQAGLQLVYESKAVQSLRTSGVKGRMTTEAALRQLLKGLPLSYRYLETGAVTIEPKAANSAARVLGPVRVEGAEATKPVRGEGVAQLGGIRGGQDQETRGLRPVVANVGVGEPTPIEDIPRAVSVLTAEQIEKQDITTIGEALNRLPGVTVVQSSNNNPDLPAAVVSRGFRIEKVQVDGGPARSLNIIDNGLLDIGPYERIELIQGPNGAYVGDGSPGGTLNLVRKRPGMVESLKVTATAGSFDRRQLGVEYSTPTLAGSPFAFLGTASFQDTQYFYDASRKRDSSFSGMFDTPLGDRARFEFGFTRTDIHETGSYNGVPRYLEGDLIDVPRTFNYTPPGAYTDSTSNELFGIFNFALPRNWNMKVQVSYTDSKLALVNPVGGILLSQVTKAAPKTLASNSFLFLREQANSTNTLGANFVIAGHARTVGIDHSLSVSGDFVESASPRSSQQRDAVPTPTKYYLTRADLDSPYPSTTFAEFSRSNQRYTSDVAGLTVADTLSWREWVDLNLSVRRQDSSDARRFDIQRDDHVDRPTYGQVSSVVYSPSSNVYGLEHKAYWQPNWALVLKPIKGLSVTGSVSNGNSPQDQYYTPELKTLDPVRYDNKEITVKYGTRAWIASLTGYDEKKENYATNIPGTMGKCPPLATSYCFYAQGASVKSKGVTFSIDGEIIQGLSTSASYSYNSFKTVPGVRDTAVELFTQAPNRTARMFLDWKLPFLPATSANFGAAYQNATSQAGTRTFYDPVTGKTLGPAVDYAFTEPAHVVYDIGFSHAFSRELAMNLLVENITDKKYLSTVGTNANFYGAPRSFTAMLKWNPHGDFPASGASPSTGRAPFGSPAQWYGSFELGAHEVGTFTGTSRGLKKDGSRAVWDFDTDSTALSFVRLGYRIDSHWRVETEGGFRAANFVRIGGGGGAPSGVCDSKGTRTVSSSSPALQFDCEHAPGYADTWSLMFNGIYDFLSPGARLRPFVGLGLGATRWSIDFGGKMKGVGLDTPWKTDSARAARETIGSVDQAYAWAWQATTGASFRWTDRITLTAAYTYNESPHVSWETYNMPNLTPTLGDFHAKIKDQAATLGFRWSFGPQ